MAITRAGRTPAVTNSASATSLTGTLPAGQQAGDYVVAHVAVSCTVAQFTAPDSGWVELLAPVAAVGNPTMALYGQFSPAAGPTVSMGGGATAGRMTIITAAYGGVSTVYPLDGEVQTGTTATGATYTAPGVTTTTAGALLLSGIMQDASTVTYTKPASMTLVGNQQSGVGRGAALADELLAAAGATGTRAWSTSNATTSVKGYAAALRDATAPLPAPTRAMSWVGAPTPDGFTVSAKTTDATSVRLKVGTDAALTANVVFSSAVTPDSANWSQVAISGLSAGTAYYYAVEMTGSSVVLTTGYGPVKTLPAVGTAAPTLRLVFGSCLDSGNTTATAFTNALATAPDLFFHLGDFHYADSSSTSQAVHRGNLEDQITANTGLAAILASVPTVYVKSDHDAGGGNDSLPGAHTSANRAAHLQVVPHLPQVVSNALYHTFVVGRTRFIMTDDRYVRTASEFLGTAQMEWFKAQLQESEPLKVWVQSGPWLIGDDADAGGDKWSDYPAEHVALGEFIATYARGQLVTIHGDAHIVCADDGSNNVWGGFPVIGAAPFGQTAGTKGGPYSQGHFPITDGPFAFQDGLIDIADTGSAITLTYRGRSVSNADRVTMTVTVDTTTPQLAPGTPPAALNQWMGLASILSDARLVDRELERQRPVACLDCGGPLETGPRNQLFCRFDGRRY